MTVKYRMKLEIVVSSEIVEVMIRKWREKQWKKDLHYLIKK